MTQPCDDPRSSAAVHADAYKLFDAVKALKAILDNYHGNGTIIDNLERIVEYHADILGIPMITLKTRYETYLKDREDQRVEAHIEAGGYDVAVVSRNARLQRMAEAEQRLQNNHLVKRLLLPDNPAYKKAEPKRNVAAVTIRNGHVESILFSDHGLPEGIHALAVA